MWKFSLLSHPMPRDWLAALQISRRLVLPGQAGIPSHLPSRHVIARSECIRAQFSSTAGIVDFTILPFPDNFGAPIAIFPIYVSVCGEFSLVSPLQPLLVLPMALSYPLSAAREYNCKTLARRRSYRFYLNIPLRIWNALYDCAALWRCRYLGLFLYFRRNPYFAYRCTTHY